MKGTEQERCCSTCRYRKREVIEKPCNTGVYQMAYSHQCYEWKARTTLQKWLDKIKAKRGK